MSYQTIGKNNNNVPSFLNRPNSNSFLTNKPVTSKARTKSSDQINDQTTHQTIHKEQPVPKLPFQSVSRFSSSYGTARSSISNSRFKGKISPPVKDVIMKEPSIVKDPIKFSRSSVSNFLPSPVSLGTRVPPSFPPPSSPLFESQRKTLPATSFMSPTKPDRPGVQSKRQVHRSTGKEEVKTGESGSRFGNRGSARSTIKSVDVRSTLY